MAIARIALPVATCHLFDYWIPDGLAVAPGDVVRVRLAARKLTGVVVDVDASSEYLDRIQPIDAVAAAPRLSGEIMELAAFTSAYYQAPPGLAYALAVPPLQARAPRQRERP